VTLPDAPVYAEDQLGSAAVVDAVRAWRPDVIYAHGMYQPRLDDALSRLAPTVFFIHNYHGTCISGSKRYAFPTMRPCSRRFGATCLALYYPRRCGGLNPRTMWRQYRLQRRRLAMVRRVEAVVTHSFHMFSEYARHGVRPERLHRFVYYSPEQLVGAIQRGPTFPLPVYGEFEDFDMTTTATTPPHTTVLGGSSDEPLQLTYAGRLDLSKGVQVLIDAAPIAAKQLGRRLHVSILGDGPVRPRFERQARQVAAKHPQVEFEFAGWLRRDGVTDRLRRTDLVVFPSVWPEPFGLVGPEAGNMGIPVAAFAVGGVTGWLVDDVNGRLAPGDPPTAQGLANAIAGCLRDEQTYNRLKRGAFEMAARFNRSSHLEELVRVFEQVGGGGGNGVGLTLAQGPNEKAPAAVANAAVVSSR
jgi:glycosyltransferase involved in cell wall biosynthesis